MRIVMITRQEPRALPQPRRQAAPFFQRSASRSNHLAFALMVLVIITACFRIGAVPTRQYGSDMMSFADLGWRVLNGVRPHVDFETALGPVAPLTWAAGIR